MSKSVDTFFREQELRKELAAYGKKLVESGLVQGTWGNLSVRLDEKHMLVTPSGLDYMRLMPEDMVKVNIMTLEYEGQIKPTSEKGLHGEIYRTRPDLQSIIHTHSKYCCIFAAARKPMLIVTEEGKKVFGNQVGTSGYALPGTKRLQLETTKALGNNYGAIMANHGMICCGNNLNEAFDNCVLLEECGRIYIER